MANGALSRRGRIRAWRAEVAAGPGQVGAEARAAAEALFANPGQAGLGVLVVRLRRERAGATRGIGYSVERHLALVRALSGPRRRAPRGRIRGRSSYDAGC